MKSLSGFFLILLLAVPALAQDDGDGLFDVNDLFGDDSLGNQPAAPRVDPVGDVRNWLVRANAPPLEKKQESPVKKVYEKELKAMAKPFEKRFGVALEPAIASQAATRGRRGAGAGRVNSAYTAEIRRITEQLFDKMIASLRIDQQAALRRYQSEQLRVARFNAMTESMTLAGLSLTPEQKGQMEALYVRESRLRTLIIVEARGQPHQGKVSSLEAETNEKVVQLLDQAQKAAFVEAMPGSNSR